MTIFYYLLFLFVAGLITYGYFGKRYWELILVCIGVVLFLFAGLRGDIDRDYASYVGIATDIAHGNKLTLIDASLLDWVEPTFVYISIATFAIFNGPFGLFLVYAALGVTIKLMAIRKLSPQYYLLPLLLYSTHFFFLHEMTQIRVGVACGLSFLSLVYVKDRKPVGFIILALLSVCFHYSAIMFLPIYFLRDKINIKVWAALFIVAVAMAFLPFSFLTIMERLPFMGIASNKIATYQQMAAAGIIDKINLFNPYILLNQFIICLVLCMGKQNIESVPYLSLLLKINIIGVLAFMGFKDLPVLSFRIYEYFAFAQIFLFSSMLLFVKEKKLVFFGLILLALFYLVVDVNISELLSGYQLAF